ncbi:uncharacterized protein FOMMEDRAFT_162381 [Fomitiporia mediterranea MF3/22]|uniref:uncharacterized protein n=1 Tax=Fomitiporia mediterranea (strain MF3/22) TaxID=694068 RepID=UPI000440795D|nr:uncharacterized protein FOMMEDRAFT_162381 [Fomitiporia mediterranea MF3/22]EJC98035.1 hypothetical protein FOMMEDRAFT_162381 [Fomitiporia mediterranea MF3/22]
MRLGRLYSPSKLSENAVQDFPVCYDRHSLIPLLRMHNALSFGLAGQIARKELQNHSSCLIEEPCIDLSVSNMHIVFPYAPAHASVFICITGLFSILPPFRNQWLCKSHRRPMSPQQMKVKYNIFISIHMGMPPNTSNEPTWLKNPEDAEGTSQDLYNNKASHRIYLIGAVVNCL